MLSYLSAGTGLPCCCLLIFKHGEEGRYGN